eukprot:4601184-Amphidinium_carterae.1
MPAITMLTTKHNYWHIATDRNKSWSPSSSIIPSPPANEAIADGNQTPSVATRVLVALSPQQVQSAT